MKFSVGMGILVGASAFSCGGGGDIGSSGEPVKLGAPREHSSSDVQADAGGADVPGVAPVPQRGTGSERGGESRTGGASGENAPALPAGSAGGAFGGGGTAASGGTTTASGGTTTASGGTTSDGEPPQGGAGSEPGCTEMLSTDANRCMQEKTCPDSHTDVQCTDNEAGGVAYCWCDNRHATPSFIFANFDPLTSCDQAMEECNNPGPVGEPTCDTDAESTSEVYCSIWRGCKAHGERDGLPFILETYSGVTCSKDGAEWHCECGSNPAAQTDVVTLESTSNPNGPCEEVLTLCDEGPVNVLGPEVCEISRLNAAFQMDCEAEQQCRQEVLTTSGAVAYQSKITNASCWMQDSLPGKPWTCMCDSVARQWDSFTNKKPSEICLGAIDPCAGFEQDYRRKQ